MEALETMNVELIYIENDLNSVERDIREKKLNLIFCQANETGMSIEECLQQVSERHHQAVTAFARSQAELLTQFSPEQSALRAYVDWLGTSVMGNLVGLDELIYRYPAWANPGAT